MKRTFRVTIDTGKNGACIDSELIANYICDAVASWYGGGDPNGETWTIMENAATEVTARSGGDVVRAENGSARGKS